jgi:hypothetical protein
LQDLAGEKRVVRGQTKDIMKKPDMPRVLMTTALTTAFALASWTAHGQAATINSRQAIGIPDSENAPPEEHLKVENGFIWARQPGEAWVREGEATIGNAVKALRGIYPQITFAVDPRVATLPVTDLLIRANEAKTDLDALRTACGSRFDLGGGEMDVSGQPNSLYALVYNSATEANPAKREDRNIECFNLTGYLERIAKHEDNKKGEQPEKPVDQAVDQLQQIIKSTIADFDSTINPPHFQFYAQAQLLIVTGSRRGIEVAGKVIRALPGQQIFDEKAYGLNLGTPDRAGQPAADYPVVEIAAPIGGVPIRLMATPNQNASQPGPKEK